MMSTLLNNSCLRRLLAAAGIGLSVGLMTVPSAPAKARVFVTFGFGAPVGWGYYAPRPYYGYYGYPYRPYYRAYYGYPGIYIGPHRYWHHWRHWHHGHHHW
jgi:hypothetical protein